VSPRPKVSIGVPVYNGERFLPQTLDSLLAQTFEDFELIVADNASTDTTEQICRDYARRDRRVVYERSPENRGATWNLNRLVDLATSDYFKWAMADDLCSPDHLRQCVEALDRDSGAVLACTQTSFIDENGNDIGAPVACWDLRSDRPADRLRSVIQVGGHWANADALAGVIRREAVAKTRCFPRYQGGDKRPLAELSLLGRFVEIPGLLQQRRIHGGNTGAANPAFATKRREQIDWMLRFFGGSRWEVVLPTWCLYVDYLGIIGGSSLRAAEKMRLAGDVLRVAKWNRHYLGSELTMAFRVAVIKR
jgi:glycosyltransferase involved in cell wall biosynthesis